jgi:hypothetical protein
MKDGKIIGLNELVKVSRMEEQHKIIIGLMG